MKIVAISDLHGHLPELPTTDIVCIAGDIVPVAMNDDIEAQWRWYNEVYLPWVEYLSSRYVITVAGNHDTFVKRHKIISTDKHRYLENNGVELMGYSFYGTPNTSKLDNHLTHMPYDNSLREIFETIPDKLDFLLCHHSPFGANNVGALYAGEGNDIGSKELADAVEKKDIRYIFCGHIHTGNHSLSEWRGKKIANVALRSESMQIEYEPLILKI